MQTRRSFSETLINVLGGVMGAAIAGLGGVYLMTPARKQKVGGWVAAADASKLTTGVAEEVLFERRRADGWRLTRERSSAWIVKKSDQEIIAFAPGCTHLGCAFRYEAEKKNFICPCHVSEFTLDGNVISGPAPRPLDQYEVKLDHGRVLLGEIKKA